MINCKLQMDTPKPRMELFFPSRIITVLPELLKVIPDKLILDDF